MNQPAYPRFLGRLAIVWATALVLRQLFHTEINGRLWIGAWLIDAGLVLSGIGLAIGMPLLLWRTHRRAALGWTGGIVLLGGIAYATAAGPMLGVYQRAWRNHGEYAEIAAEAARDPAAAAQHKGVEIDAGPPVRVAFSWGGLLDNWHGIVHDPSGAVLDANLPPGVWETVDPAAREARAFFGGTLVRVRHLWGDWYYCQFT